jgi:tRNA (uracil-5-)-methyltransferase TRM9
VIVHDQTQAFYIDRGEDYARSRQFFMQGWRGFIAYLPQKPLKVLDIGCGQGRFGEYLLEQQIDFERYVGMDYSPTLLKIAGQALPKDRCEFIAGDIRDDLKWNSLDRDFDVVVTMNVLHHLEIFDERIGLLEKIQQRLVPGGVGGVSLWQMHKKDKLLAKAKHLAGKNDYVLPFGHNPLPVRFVHSFDEKEIELIRNKVLTFGRVSEWCGTGPDKDNWYLMWLAGEK